MKHSTKTIFLVDLQTTILTGRRYKTLPNTTLNEKFNIQPEITTLDTYPTIQYLAVGNGLSKEISAEESIIKHAVTDGALYNHVPFVIRPVDDDLLPADRAHYRLRNLITINNKEYVEYHLKKIDMENGENRITEVTVNEVANTLSLYNPRNYRSLRPLPLQINPTKTDNKNYIKTNKYIMKMLQFHFTLTEKDLEELQNSIEIKFGGTVLFSRVLKELAVCSGVEYNDEIAMAQIMYFKNIDIDVWTLLDTKETINDIVEIGGMEPLLLQ